MCKPKIRSGKSMSAKKESAIPVIKIRKGATKKEIYAAVKRSFTADDLYRFFIDEPMVPAELVLKELEEQQHRLMKERNGKLPSQKSMKLKKMHVRPAKQAPPKLRLHKSGLPMIKVPKRATSKQLHDLVK